MTGILSLFRSYFRRSSESGQSVVLLGLGFVMLAGFVGITTDISLMFVRYAQLSRAVDSAAIAAANQMRQDRSNASVQLAARQFIEFYGLSPQQVIVDTCLTTNYQDTDLNCVKEPQSKLVRVRAYFRQPTVFISLIGIHWFDMWVSATSQTAALDVVIVMDVSESMAIDTSYSDWAYVEKLGLKPGLKIGNPRNYGVIYRPPTTNEIINRLNLVSLGLDNVTASTKFWTEWKIKGQNGAPIPGLLQNRQYEVNNFLTYYSYNPTNGAIGTGKDPGNDNIGSPGYNAEPSFRVDYVSNYFNNGISVEEPRVDCRVRFYPRAQAVDLYGPRSMRGAKQANGTVNSYLQLLKDVKLWVSPDPLLTDPALKTLENFDGFVPTYNFYGCCNNPDGVDGFDDLVCMPFKEVRDATFDFLERIDFVRGDRAAFVTYDRTAVLVNPYSAPDGQRPEAMLEDKDTAYHTLKNLIGVRAEPYFYAMDPAPGATSVSLINQWRDFAPEIRYDDKGKQVTINYNDLNYDPTKASFDQTKNYPVYDNCPVQNASLDATRSLFPEGLPAASLPTDLDRPDTNYLTMGYDKSWKDYKTNGMNSLSQEPIIFYQGSPAQRKVMTNDMSYEYWAACRNGNIGAALREANNALINPSTSHKFGTIWIIILMSDGGAGASDPVRKNGKLLAEAKPYEKNLKTGTWGIPGEYGAFGLCPMGTPINPGELVLYGNDRNSTDAQASVPACSDEDPASRHTCDFRPLLYLPSNPTSVLFENARNDPMQDVDFLAAGQTNNTKTPPEVGPAVGTSPEGVVEWNKQRNHLYDVDIGPKGTVPYTPPPSPDQPNPPVYQLPAGGCEELYDVEDYARDWADYIAISNLASVSGNQQVPTIFTIGFGLKFGTKTDNDPAATALVTDTNKDITDPVNIAKAQENVYVLCRRNLGNCLGEQLLRYIADVGDNNRIDNDYYQDLMYEWYHFDIPGFDPGDSLTYAINGKVGPLGETFGTRDACQTQVDLAGAPIIPNNNTYDSNGNNKLDGLDISGKNAGLPDGAYNYYDNDARSSSLSANINTQNSEFGREWGQLRGNLSCGNYYYSPTAQELQFVFDDIASRMFTRLSR